MKKSQSPPGPSSLLHRDRLSLMGMTFHAHHGYEEHEITNGQRFEVDVEMILDITQAATTDHLSDAVDYRRVYQQIQDIVLKQRFYLIETLSLRVATAIGGESLVVLRLISSLNLGILVSSIMIATVALIL